MEATLFKKFSPKEIAGFIECQARDLCRDQKESGSVKSAQCLFDQLIDGKWETIEFTFDVDYTAPRYIPNYVDSFLESWQEVEPLDFTFTITDGMYIDHDGYGHALSQEQLGEVMRFV